MTRRTSHPKTIEAGDPRKVGVNLVFIRDSDSSYASSDEERSSWGEFSLWVDGRNLTLNRLWGEERNGFRWYLLDLIEWLVASWDPLLHEERMVVDADALDAAEAA